MNSNLALITTLYDTPGADFYKDIYFPLIKYSIMSIYYDNDSKEKHYDVLALQEKIKEKAGIPIPLHVLKASVCALSRKGDESGIHIYEGGNYFKVSGSFAIGLDTIESNADQISSQYRKLELFFAEYLESEKLTSSKSLKEFLQNNTVEVLDYLNNITATSVVNQDYVNVVRFLDWIKEAKPEYYQVAENLLWGSIVAGFLQRSNTNLGIKTIEKVDYYLDSSLVLSLLGLDSDQNVAYAKDLTRIITDAGSTVKVHAITIREIKRILEQVELSQGPRRGSSIEMAWAQQDLALSDILRIRNRLAPLLEENNVVILPLSDNELDRIELQYRNNYDVRLLAEKRGYRTEELVREIHDIYMRDFVQGLNQGGTVLEKQSAYFVSLNSDLVEFSHREQGITMSVIHAAKVVMNLWLHSTKSELIKKTVLSEVMSRCYALNQTDVRIKLKVFYKYYRDCSLTQGDIEGMYTSLIHRSAQTISVVEELMENEENGPENKADISIGVINGLKAAIAKEREEREASSEATKRRVQELVDRTEALECAIEEGKSDSNRKDEIIRNYEEKSIFDDATIERLSKELQTQQELRKIDSALFELYNKRQQMNKEREESVSLFKFWIVLVVEILALGSLAVCVVFDVYSWCKTKTISIEFTIGSAVSFLVLATRISGMYLLSPHITKMKLREEQNKCWENDHPEYKELTEKISDLEMHKRELEGV